MCLSAVNSELLEDRVQVWFMSCLFFRPSTGEACLMFSVLFAEFFGTPCLCWLVALTPWLCSWIWLSGPPSTSFQWRTGFQEATLPLCPDASLLAWVPLWDFLPSGQLIIQACIAYGNTMKLDLKKPVVITTIIILYTVKNLGRKEGGWTRRLGGKEEGRKWDRELF